MKTPTNHRGLLACVLFAAALPVFGMEAGFGDAASVMTPNEAATVKAERANGHSLMQSYVTFRRPNAITALQPTAVDNFSTYPTHTFGLPTAGLSLNGRSIIWPSYAAAGVDYLNSGYVMEIPSSSDGQGKFAAHGGAHVDDNTARPFSLPTAGLSLNGRSIIWPSYAAADVDYLARGHDLADISR